MQDYFIHTSFKQYTTEYTTECIAQVCIKYWINSHTYTRLAYFVILLVYTVKIEIQGIIAGSIHAMV